MKKNIFILSALLLLILSSCSSVKDFIDNKKLDIPKEEEVRQQGNEKLLKKENNIQTTVFTLDLSKPTNRSLQITNGEVRSRLVSHTKRPIAFLLKNVNPLKYKYVINHEYINFFEDAQYNPQDSVAKYFEKLQVPSTRGGGASGVVSGASYTEVSINSKTIISNNTGLAIQLLISPITANNKEDDFSNIKGALRIVEVKLNNDAARLNSEIAKFTAEDFLNKDELIAFREDINDSYVHNLLLISQINNDVIILNDERIKKEYEKLLQPIQEVINAIKTKINKLYQLQFEYYIPPVDINGKNIDILRINVERYNIEGNPTPKVYSYNVWINGGLKIDVSAGIYLTSLHDYVYETEDVEVVEGEQTLSRKKIFLQNKNEMDFGVGGMINISPRGGTWIKPSLNIGSLVTSSQKLQILAGGGLILGKEERIILHGGVACGYRNEISGRYKDDGSVSYDLGEGGVVPVRNKFATGYFLGLTYNFGKIKKAKIPVKGSEETTDTIEAE